MKIVEFRVPLPIDVDAYHRAQLYMVARSSLDERAVDVIENRPFQEGERKGQFTKKRMTASKHLPSWIKPLFDDRWSVDELSWNCFPDCKTEFSIAMLPRVHVTLESMHLSGYTQPDNALNLTPEKLEARKIDLLDIASDPEQPVSGLDPTKFHSAKSGLGPLEKDWLVKSHPKLMTCYKVVTVDCQLPFGFQARVESFIIKFIRTMILNAHRKLFCWMDDWSDLSMADIRKYEKEVQAKMREIWLAERGHLAENDIEETASEPRSPVQSVASPRAEEPAAKPAHHPHTEQLYSGGIRTGYLYKLGDGYIMRSWNLRYFVLKGALLQYFADARDAKPKEVVDLKGASVSWGGSEDKEHSFIVSPLEHRQLVLSGRTLEDSKSWFALCQKIAGGLEEPVTPPPPPPPMDTTQSPTHARSRWLPLEDSVVSLHVKLPANLPARFAEAGRLLKRGATSSWPLVETLDGVRISEDPAVVNGWSLSRELIIRVAVGLVVALVLFPWRLVLPLLGLAVFWFWSKRTGHAAAVAVMPGTAKELAVWVTDTARFRTWDKFIDQAFSQQSGKTEIVNLVSRSLLGFIRMSSKSERMHWGGEDGHFFVSINGSDPGDCWAFRDAPPRADGQPLCTVVLVSAGLPLLPAVTRVTALIGLKLISEQEPARVPPKLLIPSQWTYSDRGGLQVVTEPILQSLSSIRLSAFWAFMLGHNRIQLHSVFRHQGPSPPEALSHFFTALPDFFPTANDNPQTVLLGLVSALVSGLVPAALAMAGVAWAKPSKREGTVSCQLGRGIEAFWEVPEGSGMKGSGSIVLSGSSDFSLKGSIGWQISMSQLDGISIKLSGEPEFTYRQSSGIATALRMSLPELRVFNRRVAWVGYLKVWSEHYRCVLSLQDDRYSKMSGVILSASLGKIERHLDGSWLDAVYSDGKPIWICGAPPQRHSRVTLGSKQ